MTSREYLEDQDAEEPDDFIISLTAQVSILDKYCGRHIVCSTETLY